MKLLIADDEEITLRGLENLSWDTIGITQFYTASDGKSALELIKLYRPDIILTDIRMPEMTGLDLAKILSENKISCRIILLTGFDKFDYAQLAVKYHVFEYLLKPSSKTEIFESVHMAINSLVEERKEQRLLIPEGEISGHSLMGKIMQWLEQNYMHEISLQALANAVHISSAYCSRYIRNNTSCTFTELLLMIRMRKAAEMIIQTDEKFFIICEKVGIPDQRYFSRLFKKIFNKTPMEYKKDSNQNPSQQVMKYFLSQNENTRKTEF